MTKLPDIYLLDFGFLCNFNLFLICLKHNSKKTKKKNEHYLQRLKKNEHYLQRLFLDKI